MLRFLKIRDFALIREVAIEFGSGLNLLTGETGSGKSIIVDALGLLLGERSDQAMVRSGCEIAIVEGIFALSEKDNAAALLDGAGIDFSGEELIVRREISITGRNRIFINNGPATLSLLKSLGVLFADIHGQHDRQSLLDYHTHLQWLDRYAHHDELLQEVKDVHRRLREMARDLDGQRMDEQERLRRIDMLEFQFNEISRVNPVPEEWESLQSERKILSHREKIFSIASEAYSVLYESESSLLGQLDRIQRLLQDLEGFDASWKSQREGMQDSLYRLEDLALAVRDYTSRFDFSPERMEQVEQRLVELERLVHRYGPNMEDVLAFREKCRVELEDLRCHQDRTKELAERLQAELLKYSSLAESLSTKRRRAAAALERAIRAEFRALSMEQMELLVHFQAPDAASGVGNIPSHYGPAGIDRVEFLVTPNKGEEMKPMARIASGGELSRVMLAIRTICQTGDEGMTLVFDEIDAGIGGRVAEAIGRRLRAIANGSQVLCVTHLAQIACFADLHYRVTKRVAGARTETLTEPLKGEERVAELARMLGGETITEKATAHAREMLAQASDTVRSAAK